MSHSVANSSAPSQGSSTGTGTGSACSNTRRALSLLSVAGDIDVLRHGIIPYLDRLRDVPNLAMASRYFFALLYSSQFTELWQNQPIDVCLDKTCRFGCGRVRLASPIAYHMVSRAPIEQLRMHIPFESMSMVLDTVLTRGTIERLHFRFRVDSTSIIRCKSLRHIPSNMSTITHLTLFGWPEQAAAAYHSKKLQKICKHLLRIVGCNLTSLHFLESSPANLFEAVAASCPHLQSLKIEGIQSSERLAMLQSCGNTLRELSLRDTGMALIPLHLPNLQRLEFVDKNSSLPPLLIASTVASIPLGLRELEIGADRILANTLLVAVAGRCSSLETLTVHFTVCHGDQDIVIDAHSLAMLAQGCPQLRALEVMDGFVDLADEALPILPQFACLQRLKIFYTKRLLRSLPGLLKQMLSLREVSLLENSDDFIEESGSPNSWVRLEKAIQCIGEQFPSVDISLVDCWWSE